MQSQLQRVFVPKHGSLLPKPDLTSVLALIVSGSRDAGTTLAGLSVLGAPQAKYSQVRAALGPVLAARTAGPEPIILPNLAQIQGQDGPERASNGLCNPAQVFAAARVKLGERLRNDAAFRPFTLPSGETLQKRSAAVSMGLGPTAAPATMPIPTAPAEQAMAAFLPPAPIPPAGAAIGLTPGAPQDVPGNSAIKSTIQTQGPLSASGDFGNPNAGQSVRNSAPGMKMAKYPALLRLKQALRRKLADNPLETPLNPLTKPVFRSLASPGGKLGPTPGKPLAPPSPGAGRSYLNSIIQQHNQATLSGNTNQALEPRGFNAAVEPTYAALQPNLGPFSNPATLMTPPPGPGKVFNRMQAGPLPGTIDPTGEYRFQPSRPLFHQVQPFPPEARQRQQTQLSPAAEAAVRQILRNISGL